MRFISLILLLSFMPTPVVAQAVVEDASSEPMVQEREERLTEERRRMREEVSGMRVDEQLGEQIDLSLTFRDQDGRLTSLGEFVADDRPTVVTFVYHDCPMLCSFVLNALTDVMQETRLTLGRDYQVLAVSIDPADTPEQAAEAHRRYTAQLDDDADPASYIFLTGDEASITALTDQTGFRYEWLEDRQEFGHTAALIFLTPTGVISRYLYGIQYAALDFRRAVIEAGEGKVGSPIDQILLYCFAFDSSAGGYVLHAANAMRVGGFGTVAVLLATLLFFWRREARANRSSRSDAGGWSKYEDALRTAPGT